MGGRERHTLQCLQGIIHSAVTQIHDRSFNGRVNGNSRGLGQPERGGSYHLFRAEQQPALRCVHIAFSAGREHCYWTPQPTDVWPAAWSALLWTPSIFLKEMVKTINSTKTNITPNITQGYANITTFWWLNQWKHQKAACIKCEEGTWDSRASIDVLWLADYLTNMIKKTKTHASFVRGRTKRIVKLEKKIVIKR